MEIEGVKLMDAGYKPKKEEMVKAMPESNEPEMRYPSMYVDDKEMPAIKGEDFGDTCLMIAVVKVRKKSVEETTSDGKKETRVSADLQILKAGFKDYDQQEDEAVSEMKDEEIDEALKGEKK